MSDSKPTTVRELMTTDVATLKRNDKLSVADNVMSLNRIRHLVVLDEDEVVVGIVSQRDLFRGALLKVLGYGSVAEKKIMDTVLVKEVMATDVATATPQTPPSQAAQLMMQRKIGCLAILEDTKLVGIITESDFVAYFAKQR